MVGLAALRCNTLSAVFVSGSIVVSNGGMRTTTQLLIALAITSSSFAQPQLDWAKHYGGPSFDYGNAIAIDDSGYVYLTGRYQGTADLDPGTGIYNLTSSGGREIYVSKLSGSGDLIWAVSMGGAGSDEANDIAVDDDGNVYITGQYMGPADFDPGPGTFNLLPDGGFWDTFVCKLDNTGNLVWAKGFGGATGNDNGLGIAVDGAGSVYTTGFFMDTADFDPGLGVYELGAGGEDIFVQKLDENGNFMWAYKFGGLTSAWDEGNAITINGPNVYLTGWFNGIVDFDPGPGSHWVTANGSTWGDTYVLNLDTSGSFNWMSHIGGSSSDEGTKIITDLDDNIILTGEFSGTTDFDPGPGTFELTPGARNVFVCKLDQSGGLIWVSAFSSNDALYSRALASDETGNIYVGGRYDGTVDFDPGSGTHWMVSTTYEEAYVVKVDSAGDFEWVGATVGNDYVDIDGVAIDSLGGVLFTGHFYQTADFDPQGSVYNMSTPTSADNQAHLCRWMDPVLSVDESELGVLNMYPNPTSDLVNIRWDGDDEQLMIHDCMGRMIHQEFVPGGGNTVQLVCSDWTPGMYFVRAGAACLKLVVR